MSCALLFLCPSARPLFGQCLTVLFHSDQFFFKTSNETDVLRWHEPQPKDYCVPAIFQLFFAIQIIVQFKIEHTCDNEPHGPVE